MKTRILELIEKYPKHYARLILKDATLLSWINENSLIMDDHLPSRIYSAIYQVSNVCANGNAKKFDRFSTGFIGCGLAKT